MGWEVTWCGPSEARGGGKEEGEVKDSSSELPSTEMGNTEREADLKGKSRVLEMLCHKHRPATSVHKQLEMPVSRSGGKTWESYIFGQK